MNRDNILLLDIGNTRIKWAWLSTAGLEHTGSVVHAGLDLRAHADAVWGKVATPARIVASNVAGAEVRARLSEVTQALWQREPELVCAQASACGVSNGYAEPGTLGADRWLALIAARSHTSNAVCVIDCGTAITLDTLMDDGDHVGGIILPGLALMQRAVCDHTQLIATDVAQAPYPLTPHARSTHAAVQCGALYAVVGAIERAVADTEAALGTEVSRIITGGDAQAVLAHLNGHYQHQPDLVLQGLAIVAGERS
ncbi:MAG: type III pantothenate kinase [Gammaproteobacteria bacterium]|nr:type III pantothenate kinase [Gammaproteobacteria bacterium]